MFKSQTRQTLGNGKQEKTISGTDRKTHSNNQIPLLKKHEPPSRIGMGKCTVAIGSQS